MNEQKLKRYTLLAAAALLVVFILGAIFGGGRSLDPDDPQPLTAARPSSPETPASPASPETLASSKAPASSASQPASPLVSLVSLDSLVSLESDKSDKSDKSDESDKSDKSPESAESAKSEPASQPSTLPPDDFATLFEMILSRRDTIRSLNPYELHHDSMPPGGRRIKINYLGASLGRVFNDSNKFHIAVAEQIGIKPLTSLRSAWEAGAKVERLRSCREYYLDNLTHSMPYLVPRAHRLLKDIGAAFRDSLQSRGGGDYRIKVTSVLRTPRLVKRLRRRNHNAVDTSAHLFGTTFDISYAKFICDSTGTPRTQEDLKNLLGEVINDQRLRGRCFVKYERKQACFHITAR